MSPPDDARTPPEGSSANPPEGSSGAPASPPEGNSGAPANPPEGSFEGFADDPPGGRSNLLLTVAIFGALVAGLGLLPMAFGLGPFGSRLVTADEVPVHVLNLSGTDLTVSLSFAADLTVVAGTMETMGTLSGGSRLVARRPDGTVLDDLRFSADGPVFYNAGGGRCFAVFDISGFYGDDPDTSAVTVVARLPEDTRLYEFEADTIVLPRRTAPDQARGRVHWLEPVGCNLLDPDEESYLIGQNLVRMQERRDRYEEELRRAREAAPAQ